MAKGNKCLGCRFGSVKLEILVPENCNLKEFIEKTQDFTSNIIAMNREKNIHYSLKFGTSEDSAIKLNFKIRRSCTLKLKKNVCSSFKSKEENDRTTWHLLYIQPSASEKIEIML